MLDPDVFSMFLEFINPGFLLVGLHSTTELLQSIVKQCFQNMKANSVRQSEAAKQL